MKKFVCVFSALPLLLFLLFMPVVFAIDSPPNPNTQAGCEALGGDFASIGCDVNTADCCCDSEADLGHLADSNKKMCVLCDGPEQLCGDHTDQFLWLSANQAGPYVYSLPTDPANPDSSTTFDVIAQGTTWVGCNAAGFPNSNFPVSQNKNYGGIVTASTHEFICYTPGGSETGQSLTCEKTTQRPGASCDTITCPPDYPDTVSCVQQTVEQAQQRAICEYSYYIGPSCVYGANCALLAKCNDGSLGICNNIGPCGFGRTSQKRTCSASVQSNLCAVSPTCSDVGGTPMGSVPCQTEAATYVKTCKKTIHTECAQPASTCPHAGYTQTGPVSSCSITQSSSYFGECCGSLANCLKSGDHEDTGFALGDSLLINSQNFYCAQTGTQTSWTTNLDGNTDYMSACINAGFSWTGLKCCGDLTTFAEASEYYNDIDTEIAENLYGAINDNGQPVSSPTFSLGGCFNGISIPYNALVSSNNIIKDGDFNNPLTDTSPWARFGGADSGNTYIQTEQLKISRDPQHVPPDPSQFGVSQNIAVRIRSGEEYIISARALVSPGSSGTSVVGVYDLADNLVSGSQLSFTQGNNWQEKQASFIMPPSTAGLKIKVFVKDTTSEVRFDDIILRFKEDSIMNFNGTFYSCNLLEDVAAAYDDTTTPDAQHDLLTNDASCQIRGSYFCAPNTSWSKEGYAYDYNVDGEPVDKDGTVITDLNSLEPAKQRDIKKDLPSGPAPDNLKETGCCPNNYCWDGNKCLLDQTGKVVTAPFEFNGKKYVCSDDHWEEAALQTGVDNLQGFCPKSACLIKASAPCLPNSEYAGDYYCENGILSSRTKFVILELLKLADKENVKTYTLYCSDYKEALNEVDYMSGSKNAEDYITGGAIEQNQCHDQYGYGITACANNFCVLNYTIQVTDESFVLFGTSLNNPINEGAYPFSEIIDLVEDDSDDPAELLNDCYADSSNNPDNPFISCPARNGFAQYDPKMKIVIYSDKEIDLVQANYLEAFAHYLGGPIQSIINLILHLIYSPPPALSQDYAFVQDARRFDKAYFNENEDISVRGFQSSKGASAYLTVKYTGINVDLCKSIDLYDENVVVDPLWQFGKKTVYCSQADGAFHVITQGSPELQRGLVAWQDLTAKLRILGEQNPTLDQGFCAGGYQKCSALGGSLCGQYEKCTADPIDSCEGTGIAKRCCNSPGTCQPKTCIDGTVFGQCVNQEVNIKYCDPDTGSIVSNAEKCPCTGEGLLPDQNGVCIACEPEWQCTSWGDCINNLQTRTCTDLNNCGTAYTGSTTQDCEAAPTLSCSLTQTCTKTPVFALSSETNAHAEVIGGAGNYPWKVCCQADSGTLTTAATASETNILYLRGQSNAHAATQISEGYTTAVTLGHDSKAIQCVYEPDCSSDYTCLASISDLTNAHTATCTGDGSYTTKVCCKITEEEAPPQPPPPPPPEQCIEEGQNKPSGSTLQCCAGLTLIPTKRLEDANIYAGVCTAKCGDGICDSKTTESQDNCPKDCGYDKIKITDIINDPVKYAGRSYQFDGRCDDTYTVGCITTEGIPSPNYKIIDRLNCIYHNGQNPDCHRNVRLKGTVRLTENNVPWVEWMGYD